MAQRSSKKAAWKKRDEVLVGEVEEGEQQADHVDVWHGEVEAGG